MLLPFSAKSAQGENNGQTLVVFTFTEPNICIEKTNSGRQFGPSILAPFAKVIVRDAGYVDGLVIAREFVTRFTLNQLHGDFYKGPIECI